MSLNGLEKPFIKKFKHHGFFYIYDVNTYQLVEVEKPVYDIIDDYEDDNNDVIEAKYNGIYPIEELKRSIEKIKNAREKYGLFSNFRPQKITMGSREADEIKELHGTTGLNQMILEITRDCNLNCQYCPTSGKYSDAKAYQSYMSKEICMKSVDFFCEHSADTRNSQKPFISFYGGEPVKRFDLLKETVEHVKQTFGEGKYGFNLTTNGTLLTKEIIDFLIENDFLVLISLDGSQKRNDRYRIFRKNGKGAFHTIMKNLEFLKQYNNGFFSRNVSISSVLTPPFDDIDETLNFFSQNEILSEIRAKGRIRSSLVDTRGTKFIEDFGLEEGMKGSKDVHNKLLQRLKKRILGNDLKNLTIERNHPVYSILNNLAKRPIKRLYEYAQPLGACHIGLRRVFVRANGDFYICERSGDDYKIGCIGSGFDYEKIAGYYRKFEEVLKDCKNCWALSHCERCWAQIGNLDEFHGKNKEEFCSSSKRIIETAFKVYTELIREDPDCLKVFEDVVTD